MTYQEVIQHFGSKIQIACALRISYQAVQAWEAKDRIPLGRQCQLQLVTNGKLKADDPSGALSK